MSKANDVIEALVRSTQYQRHRFRQMYNEEPTHVVLGLQDIIALKQACSFFEYATPTSHFMGLIVIPSLEFRGVLVGVPFIFDPNVGTLERRG